MGSDNSKIAVLFDLENVVFNHIWSDNEKFSLTAGFDSLLAWLKDFGEIAMFCVFFPTHFIQKGLLREEDLDYFQKMGIFPIICPKIGQRKEDTTDVTLIKWGLEILLPHMSDITHLCIGSGDIDFIRLQGEAQNKGLQLMIVAGIPDSLSGEVKRKADTDLHTGKPMVYYFSPYRD